MLFNPTKSSQASGDAAAGGRPRPASQNPSCPPALPRRSRSWRSANSQAHRPSFKDGPPPQKIFNSYNPSQFPRYTFFRALSGLRSLLLARGLLTRAPPSKGPLPSPSLLLAAFPSALSLAGAWPLGACLGPGSPRPFAKFGKFWARWVSSLEAISQNWAQGASKDRAFSLQLKNNFL